ncbi:MAG: hypothetical protein ABIP94_14210, partial [Planctomycetota bacterium]
MDWQDRQTELARLDHLSKRRDGGFAVLWGRRRVGKTRLLVEWVRQRNGVYFVADETTPALQRQRLAEAIAVVLPGFDDVEYRDWGGTSGRSPPSSSRSRERPPCRPRSRACGGC